nr:hypothetical protein [Tanacetum cinerariifolium]
MGDEHLTTISATELDEFIKSGVENLILIPSESAGIPEHMRDVPFYDNYPPLDVSKDQIEDFSESNEEFSLIDDDSFSIDDIDFVEASPPDSGLVSSEVMEIVIPKVGGIDDDILLTIKDDILREKLLNVNLLIAKIEALNAPPTPSSDCKTKSSSTSLNSLLEETNTFDNSLPEFETFCFDVEEISSGSTTTPPDISLSKYEVFHDDHVKEISSGSPTTHSDSSLYASFIFDLSINLLPPADRNDIYEFSDELIPFISPPEYDCFLFKFGMKVPDAMINDAIKKKAGYMYYMAKKVKSKKAKIIDEPEEQHVSPIKSERGKGFMCYGDQVANVPNKLKKDVVSRKTRSLTTAEETVVDMYNEWGQKLKGPAVKDPVVQSLLDLRKGLKASRLESLRQKKQPVAGEGSSLAHNKYYSSIDTDSDATLYSSSLDKSKENANETDDADESDMDLPDDNLHEDDDAANFIQTLLDETPANELTDFMSHPVYIDAQTTSVVHNPEGNPELTSYISGASQVPLGTHVDVLATKTLMQKMFLDENAHHISSLPAKKIPYPTKTPQPSSLQAKANKLMQKAKKNMRKINFKKAVTHRFREYYHKLEAITNFNLYEAFEKDVQAKSLTEIKKLLPTYIPNAKLWLAKRRTTWFDLFLKSNIDQDDNHILGPSAVSIAKKFKELIQKDKLTIAYLEGTGLERLKVQYNNDVELEYHVIQLKAAVLSEAQWNKERYATSIIKYYVARYYKEGIEDRIPKRWSKDVHHYHFGALNDKLHHLPLEFVKDFNNALLMFIRRNLMKNMVEDIQLGVESYKRTLNLTKPTMCFEGIDQSIPFTMTTTHKGHMLSKNKLGSGNKRSKGRDWIDDDVKSSKEMLKKIDEILRHREQLRRLEEYVGGRPKTVNLHTFVRPLS